MCLLKILDMMCDFTMEVQQEGTFQIEEEALYNEVEDIMCDQGIITAEWNVDIHSTSSNTSSSPTRLRVAVAVVARTVFPVVVGIYSAYLRNQQTVVDNFRRNVLPNVLAFLANSVTRSLSSVQRGISYPLSFTTVVYRPQLAITDTYDAPEKSVDCCILAEPADGIIQSDIIFIHGLHGSLMNTWKQGIWNTEGHRIKQAVLERSKSVGSIPDYVLKHTLKRSVSDAHGSGIRSKMARREGELWLQEQIDEESVYETVEKDPYSLCWPRDWLPKDLPGVRVIALNYTTDKHLWRPVWIKKENRSSMVERSQEMIDHLLEIGVGNYPIVWVGHSKGGLFVKQIIVHSWENQCQQALCNLYTNTKAIMFYSVPHRGASLADVKVPLLKRSIELTEVQRNCEFVLKLHEKFLEICKDVQFEPEIFSFIETSLTFMSFIYLKIVAFESADLEMGSKCGVPLDHREICKPSGRDCILYQELVRLIKKAIPKWNTNQSS